MKSGRKIERFDDEDYYILIKESKERKMKQVEESLRRRHVRSIKDEVYDEEEGEL